MFTTECIDFRATVRRLFLEVDLKFVKRVLSISKITKFVCLPFLQYMLASGFKGKYT